MTDFYEAVEMLKETRKAMRRADELIERAIATESHPSAANDMAESCMRLKAKLEEEIVELEKAIEIGGR
jgi:bacterioferritin (cytochrome b1)